MDVSSKFGKACVITKEMQAKGRVNNLRKTVYNFGVGTEERLKGLNYVPWLCSLTYRNVGDWNPKDITYFLNRVRIHLYRRGLPFIYVWVAELQKRGALHYHVLIWLPKGFKLPKFARFGWWSHGFTDQKIARKSVGYLMKYVSKTDSKNTYPSGVRIYGYGGANELVKRRIRFFRCNKTVRIQIVNAGYSWSDVDMRRVNGGKADILTGWFFPSEWKVYFFKGLPIFYKLNQNCFFDSDLILDIIKKI